MDAAFNASLVFSIICCIISFLPVSESVISVILLVCFMQSKNCLMIMN